MSPDAVIGLTLLGLFVVAPALMIALRHTRFWWLSATGLLGCGAAIVASIKPAEDDIGGIDALGNGISYIFAFFLFAYGAIGLAATSAAHRRHRAKRDAERVCLPTATAL